MRQQEQRIDNDGPDVIRSEPVPVTGPGQVETRPSHDTDGRHRPRYPEGTGDQGPDALDERGSYDNDLATTGPGPAWPKDPSSDARTRDDRRGASRLGEERAEDTAVDDDALPERGPTHRAVDADGGDRLTGDRGDLADASQADASQADASQADASQADTADTSPADGSRADGSQHRNGATDRPEFHEPAPLPTSFGAPTVGGAVAAAALAGSHRDPREEDTVRSGDGPADDRIDGVGDEPAGTGNPPTVRQGVPDRSLGAADATTAARTDAANVSRTDPPAGSGAQPDPPVDPFGRTAPDGSADSAAIGRAHPANPDILSAGNPDALGGGPEDRTERATGIGPGDETRTEGTGGPGDGARTAYGGLPPGAAPTEPIVAILDADAVQGFRNRWREVQLRFVDDPPGATADAHRLVEESVEAVTAALARQRDDLGGWQRDGGADTERLRMVVRRHRDFLDRLFGR